MPGRPGWRHRTRPARRRPIAAARSGSPGPAGRLCRLFEHRPGAARAAKGQVGSQGVVTNGLWVGMRRTAWRAATTAAAAARSGQPARCQCWARRPASESARESERLREAAVQPPPFARQQMGVKHLPDQRVAEGVAVTGRDQQSGGDGPARRSQQALLRKRDGRGQQVMGHPAVRDADLVNDGPGLRREAVGLGQHGIGDRGGQRLQGRRTRVPWRTAGCLQRRATTAATRSVAGGCSRQEAR